MIRGPRTKFADEGLAITFTFFRITRKVFQFGTCQCNIIARNENSIFGENFSSWRFDSRKEFFFVADHGDHHWTDAWKTDINLLNTTPWGPAIQLNKSKKSPNTFFEMLLAFLNPKHGNILTIYDDLQQIFAFCATLPARKGLALPNSQSPRAFWSSADICPSYVCAREHFYFTCIRSVKTVRLSHQP